GRATRRPPRGLLPQGGGDLVEEGLWEEEEEEELALRRPPSPVWPRRRGNAVPAAATLAACPGAPVPCAASSHDPVPLAPSAPSAAAAVAQRGGVPGRRRLRNRKSRTDPPSGDPGEAALAPEPKGRACVCVGGGGGARGLQGTWEREPGGKTSAGTHLGGRCWVSKPKTGSLESICDPCSPAIGAAPRAVRGARCFWRHASHTLHGEGSRGVGGAGAEPGRGRRPAATRQLWLGHVASGSGRRNLGSRVVEHVSAVGYGEWGEGVLPTPPVSPPAFPPVPPDTEKRRVEGSLRSASPLGLPVPFCPRGEPLDCSGGGGAAAPAAQVCVARPREGEVPELGQKQVIPGLEQSLLDMCVGEKRRAIIPSHLAYGKRGFPPSIPADAVVQYDVELIALIRANYWHKLVKGVLPLLGMAMVPALLGLIGYHLYKKANTPKVSKKKLKEEKRNKSKKK
uniref:peptidylprolyl isomerase n=1 Tax=Oryctolagus cuniculus TaxID=9986 RepID=G1TXI0_RABIT